VFFKIGLFAIGGAYSFLPLVKQETVQNHACLSEGEFLDVTAIVEVFPGAISIKFATYVGYKVAGVPGALVANVANLLPPVLCMIVALAVNLVDKKHPLEWKAVPVMVAAFLPMTLTKIHPAFILLGAALYGGLIR
jgi:chromate transporter